MQQTRRRWLQTALAAITSAGIAGCQGSDDDSDGTPTSEESNGDESANGSAPAGEVPEDESVALAVAGEWNALRTQLRDPVILGHAERFSEGEAAAERIFERFEAASGEHNAHEALEEVDRSLYESFEEALGGLRTELAAGNLDAAHDQMRTADQQLREAQAAFVGSETVPALNLLVMGTHVEDAALLASIGEFGQAAHEFTHIGNKFEESGMEEMVAEADDEAAAAFTAALNDAATAAEADEQAAATESATEAFEAALDGLYALVADDVAGTAHLGALQARGWDAATLARLGGPSQEFAHAAALNGYRARACDAVTLYEQGYPDAAVAVVEDAFEHFEGARAHEALEAADEEAYHQFEDEGLAGLSDAIAADDGPAVEAALAAVEDSLTDAIGRLGTGVEPALVEAGYLKARVEDALERYRLDDYRGAAATVEDVFERFEGNSAALHERLEATDESLYDRFEHEHLDGLAGAIEQRDDAAVAEHVAGVRETLLSFETAVGSEAQVGAVESSYTAARAFDARMLATVGANDRAAALIQETFQQFEAGAGGFHEALEDADHERYEAFEAALEAAGEAAAGGDMTAAVQEFNDQAVGAGYAVVAGASGSFGAAAAGIIQDVFAHFEEARVHEALEEADRDSYEAFEAALDAYSQALEAGSAVGSAADEFATATLRAQFAVAGAAEAAPVGEPEDGGEMETDLEGGPDVIEGVPEDADHVVEMQAVAYEPEELTVEQGDTVTWEHAGGEPHSVTAVEEAIPAEATYWASGGFESEAAAREGWENGQGAVRSGESYVHTFEAAGAHEYVCLPHKAAGMVGMIVVE